MGFRTSRKTGKAYYSKPRSSTAKPLSKQEQVKDLKKEMREERQRLQKLKRQKVAEERQKQKTQAIRDTISRLKKEQQILNALNQNRISPERVDTIRHGSKEHFGSQFRTIPGFVG